MSTICLASSIGFTAQRPRAGMFPNAIFSQQPIIVNIFDEIIHIIYFVVII